MDWRDDYWRLALGVLSLQFILGALPGGNLAAAAEPSRVIYVTSERSGSIAVVDDRSLQIIRNIRIGDRPHNLKVTKDGGLVVATQGSNAVSVVDPEKLTINRINIGATPHDLAIADGSQTMYVVSEAGLLARLDPVSRRLLQSTKLAGNPHNVIVSKETAWITDVSSRRILLVDQALRVHELPISIVGHDLALRPLSDELWITPWSSNRTVIVDPNTRKETAYVQVGREPSHKHLAFTQDGSEAWITEPSSGSIFIVSPTTRRVAERIDLGGHPHHVRFAARRAYVAVGPGELVVLDVRSRRVVDRLAVGSGVHDVAIWQLAE